MATRTWTGASGDGNWYDARNWSADHVPGTGDRAILTAGVFVFESEASADIAAITIDANANLLLPAGTSFALSGPQVSSNAGVVEVSGGSTFSFAGRLTDTGEIELAPLASDVTTTLAVTGNATLAGTGTVYLADDGTGNRIVAQGGTYTLTNDNHIEGAGTIGGGDGSLILHNAASGVINALFSDNPLVIDTGAVVSNAGVITAANDGILVIDDQIDNTHKGQILANQFESPVPAGGTVELNGGGIDGGMVYVEAGGLLVADGGGSAPDVVSNAAIYTDFFESEGSEISATNGTTLTLQHDTVTAIAGPGLILANGGAIALSGTTVKGSTTTTGATLQASDGGTLQVVGGTASVLENGTLADGNTTLTVGNGSQLELKGTLTNNGGTIALNPAGADATDLIIAPDRTDLLISGNVQLTSGPDIAGGSVTLGGNGTGNILSDGTHATLVNVDNTISGGGTIGTSDGTLALKNESGGSILAQNGEYLLINSALDNLGTVEATSGALLFYQDALTNTGTIIADGGEVGGNTSTNIAGRIDIGDGGEFSLGAGTSSAKVTFTDVAGTTGLLQLDNAGDFTGKIAFLKTGNQQLNTIDLAGVSFGSLVAGPGGNESFTQSATTSGVLSLGDSGDITLLGQYASAFTTGTPERGYTGFVLNPDSTGGTDVTYVNHALAPPAA